MSSLRHLHREWESMWDALAPWIEQCETGHVIYADSQYATTAWHNMLTAWRTELNDLMAQYSVPTQIPTRSSTGADIHLINGLDEKAR